MKHLSTKKKQLIVLFVFTLLVSIIAIIHGIFFDLDFSQIQRLTLEGIILTVFIFFPALLFIEWVFDWNNDIKFEKIEKELKELRKRIT